MVNLSLGCKAHAGVEHQFPMFTGKTTEASTSHGPPKVDLFSKNFIQ